MHFTRDQYAITLRSHTANPEALTDAFIDNAYEVAKQPHTQEVLLKILRENTSIFGIRQRALTPVQTAFKNLMDLPMQIYWGEQDPILFFSIHTSSARRFLPHVPLISLPQCGHLPQLEKSEIINAGVLEFLA
jgi:pimeloyl-ACP methyl ester carboxylesterase